MLDLQWSLDDGNTWSDFRSESWMIVEDFNDIWTSPKYDEYITNTDWQELGQIVREGYEPSLALHMFTNSRRALNQGNLKLAFIEGVTALDLAKGDFKRSCKDKYLWKSLRKPQKPKEVNFLKAAADSCGISSRDIEHTVNSREIRDAIAHEGKSLPINAENAEIELRGLLKTVVGLLSGTRLKFPSVNWTNAVLSPEKWKNKSLETLYEDNVIFAGILNFT